VKAEKDLTGKANNSGGKQNKNTIEPENIGPILKNKNVKNKTWMEKENGINKKNPCIRKQYSRNYSKPAHRSI